MEATSTMPTFDALYRSIDEEIRGGSASTAREHLTKLVDDGKLPRPQAVRFAYLAWRADAPLLGIRILNPIVRPDRKLPVEPSAEEKAEYAQCLIRVGAVEEASITLDPIAHSRVPSALLYLASAHISRWQYEDAVPPLEKYVRAADLPAYQRLVGRVNLAACYVALRNLRKSTYLLRELLHETSLRRNRLLHSNLLLVAAEHFCDRQKWDDVDRCLSSAEKLVGEKSSSYEFLVRKWRAIVAYQKSPGAAEQKGLEAIREEGNRVGQWETARQCDEFIALATKDRALYHLLYFGTPFAPFREQLTARWTGSATVPASFAWRPGSRAPQEKAATLDLLTGKVESENGRDAHLKVGQLLHRLLVTLCSDFYRPHRLAALHFQLYPGEFFNPVSSPFRVYEAVKRLRAWLDEAKLPLVIEEEHGSYRLAASGDCAIRIYKRELVSSRQAASLLQLRDVYTETYFSVGEACKVLNMSVRSAQRLLEGSVTEGALLRVGRSRATRYGFPGQNS